MRSEVDLKIHCFWGRGLFRNKAPRSQENQHLVESEFVVMSEVIPPSSSPIYVEGSQGGEGTDHAPPEELEGRERLPITNEGQICYERVIPSQAHYYKLPDPPACTGKRGCSKWTWS